MFVIFGKRLFGRVDRVPGIFHIATQFAHLFFVPLLPLGSFLVLDSRQNDKQFEGFRVPFNWKSLGFAWLRAFLTISLLAALVYGGLHLVQYLERPPAERPPLQSILVPAAGAFGFFILLRLLWAASKADHLRARDLAVIAGMDPEKLEEYLHRPPAAAPAFTKPRLAAALLGLLLMLAGAFGYAGFLPLPHRFLHLDTQQVLVLARENKHSSQFEYVRLRAPVDRQKTLCFAGNGEPTQPDKADRCFAPVQDQQHVLYVKIQPQQPDLPPLLTGVLQSQGDAFLNKSLNRDNAEVVPILDLDWGAREAARIEARSSFLVGGGALILALALLSRYLP